MNKKWVATSYVAGNERRNKFLRRWQKLGLPLPDAKTGRTGILAKAIERRNKQKALPELTGEVVKRG